MLKRYKELLDQYPFLSIIQHETAEYLGIVQNSDTQVISFYDYDQLPSSDIKLKFLELGEIWWWESNRQLPINIFLKQEFKIFTPFLKTLNTKNCEVAYGPTTCLNNFFEKRIKKRTIQLVRRIP
jgi:hypothetical protein